MSKRRLASAADSCQLTRGLLIGERLVKGGVVTTKWIRETFGVSKATAKRDMLIAETVLRATAAVEPCHRVVLSLPASRT